jgi:cytochrome c
MPWNQPKSLSVQEVYAATAYLLNMGGVVPADFTLSDKNIREVQQLLPNRNGMTAKHALWPGRELGGNARPDVVGDACMRDCAVQPKVASILPGFARNAHGNLAEQNRSVGAQRGADTSRPEAAAGAPRQPYPQAMKSSEPAPAAAAGGGTTGQAVLALAQKNNCTACHAADRKVVGPSWVDIAKKHEGKADYLAGKIRSGGSGTWGTVPMPPQTLSDEELGRIAAWLAAGAVP